MYLDQFIKLLLLLCINKISLLLNHSCSSHTNKTEQLLILLKYFFLIDIFTLNEWVDMNNTELYSIKPEQGLSRIDLVGYMWQVLLESPAFNVFIWSIVSLSVQSLNWCLHVYFQFICKIDSLEMKTSVDSKLKTKCNKGQWKHTCHKRWCMLRDENIRCVCVSSASVLSPATSQLIIFAQLENTETRLLFSGFSRNSVSSRYSAPWQSLANILFLF